MTDLELFTKAFIDAMYLSETGDDDNLISADAQLSDNARADLEADCRSFWRRARPYVAAEDQRRYTDYSAAAHAGHDFWLTRNGHGTGFWDGDWPVHGDKLTQLAQAYGEIDVYEGDDGLIHV